MRCLQTIPHLPEAPGKALLGDGLIVDLDALANEAQVRRCIQADDGGESLGVDTTLGGEVVGEDGGDEGRGRAFAFGAGNMDGIQAVEVGGLL